MTPEKIDDYDIFIIESIFPDPESIFKFRLKPIQEVKNEAIIVLDTNVLLVPYTIGKKSLEEIRSIYVNLTKNNRLLIPSQVAREFAKNRGKKITEIITALREINNKQVSLQFRFYPLLESIDIFSALNETQKEVSEKLKEYYKTLTILIQRIKEWRWNDPVTLMYGEIFSKEIFFTPEITKEKLKSDLKRRIVHKIPPGFEDEDKPDEGMGDVLIWHSILEIGKKQNKDVIFVSNDLKKDWWHKDRKTKGEILFPRYELIEEFRQSSKGRSLHILSFLQFLKLFEAEKNLIKEVEKAKRDFEPILSQDDFVKRIIWYYSQFEEKLGVLEEIHSIDTSEKLAFIDKIGRLEHHGILSKIFCLELHSFLITYYQITFSEGEIPSYKIPLILSNASEINSSLDNLIIKFRNE